MSHAGSSNVQDPWRKTLLAPPGSTLGVLRARPTQPTDAAELLRDVCLRARDRADAANVAIVVHCACGSIRVHAVMFTQALLNLLDNAIAATRSGRSIFIDARQASSGDMTWRIQDTGRGMDRETLSRLTSPIDPTDARGVPLANAVIQEHGGLLSFESALGVGTTASVWLPATAG